MKLLLLLLLLTFLLSHETGADEIFGGKESRPHSRPYMVFLNITRCNKMIRCGGFLIRSDFVMTAAHCEGDFITVKLGAHNIRYSERTWQTINVKHQFPHPEYNGTRFLNDIMLLKLEKKANLTAAVKTIPLTSRLKSVLPGQECLAAGWGRTKPEARASDTLQEVELTLRNSSDCKDLKCFNERSHLCVGTPNSNKTTLKGDSGGPLVCSGVAQGIDSYGKNKPPSVFTRIAHYRPWIDKILKAN
ncbi:chymase isoform X2 [Sarcophilus harrisii]|uniref:Peptidase S1 domain-containing protein n=1 Tax=Sarcophilus harrisii TaxID=9305 RepID=A0A7N4NFZ5_SARHA|nr:chymase isoform X2 [Sarcophilus harrisii]